MVQLNELRRSFRQLYAQEGRIFSAPGRVNLIGEHTDYNSGFVLPFAANQRTYVAAANRNDSLVRVHSFNLNKDAEFDLESEGIESGWLAYVQGVARVLAEKGHELGGANIAISSEVSMGAGLSSSAALEISSGYAFLKLADGEIDLLELALSAQLAEHRFAGTESGVMDQLTSIFGVKNHAMLIDCRSLVRKQIPLNIPSMAIVVCDTAVKHRLSSSAYNLRRHECRQAVTEIRKHDSSVQSLRDVDIEKFEFLQDKLDRTLRRRARHVLSENQRTLSAAEALQDGDVQRLGRLMNYSHVSLRDDYEVSCRELDIMVDLARQQEGVAGARMMGGGFGGSTVNLVSRGKVEQFRSIVSEAYQGATGLAPSITLIEADEGVRESS